MTEEQLRALVREAVARHLTRESPPGAPPEPAFSAHSSHGRFLVPAGGDGDGSCLIEPAVRCNHCGYCQSYGH